MRLAPANPNANTLPAVRVAAAWALVDQILSSGTNFVTGLLVARTIGPAGYGAFTLAFGSWVLLLGVTRSMLVQPYIVTASGATSEAWDVATRGSAAGVLVFGTLFGIVAITAGIALGVDTLTGSAFIALGIFAAPLALQDFWRFAAFAQSLPRSAAYNDAAWAIVQALSFSVALATHTLTPATAIGSWGLGAVAGALFGLRQFGVWPAFGRRERTLIRKNARLSGWFGIANASFEAGSYGTLLLIAAAVGQAALGGLGSARNVLAPARLVISSVEVVFLPLVVRVAKQNNHNEVRRLCRYYSLGAAIYFAIIGCGLILAGPFCLRLLFGDSFVQFFPLLLPVVAATVAGGLAFGFALGLRALSQGRTLATIQLFSSVSRLGIVALALPFGIITAAWGLAGAEIMCTSLCFALFHKVSRVSDVYFASVGPDVAFLRADDHTFARPHSTVTSAEAS